MSRPRASRSLGWMGGAAALLCCASPAFADPPQNAPKPAPPAASAQQGFRADLAVLQALIANPITAPYRIGTGIQNGQVVLSGRVGTKQVHDAAVQTAMATGFPIRDDLQIDTAEAHRVAVMGSAAAARSPWYVPSLGASPYIYPPPLFGRLDDPFFGFEPPLLSYPPWWRGVGMRGMSNGQAAAVPAGVPMNMPAAGAPAMSRQAVDPNAPTTFPNTGAGPPGQSPVEMTIDERGVAVLRGTVPTLADRIAIGQNIAQTPGVREVINLLNVGPASDAPPPPPQPANGPAAKPPAAPRPSPLPNEAQIPIAVDHEELTDRIALAAARAPALANLPIRVATRDGVAYLSGKVPTVYEAMLVYRTVQQTPGVREIDDRLEFVVPDGEHKNPLLQKGRPGDVEPYLLAQVRRQLGDFAHVDRVDLEGQNLTIRGTIRNADDRGRLDAVLRSMPVLRGFRVEPVFAPE